MWDKENEKKTRLNGERQRRSKRRRKEIFYRREKRLVTI